MALHAKFSMGSMLVVSLVASCGEGLPPDDPGEETGAVAQALATPCTPAARSFCIDDLSNLSLHLGQTGTLTSNLRTGSLFNGSINLNVLRPDLNSAAKPTEVLTAISPATLTATASQTYPLTVTVEATTQAPPVNAKNLNVRGTSGSKVAYSNAAALTVDGMLLVEYSGSGLSGSPHLWKIDGKTLPLGSTAPAVKLNATKWNAAGGIQLQFTNLGPGSHVVHGDGVIPHQNTAAPTPPGGSYLLHGPILNPGTGHVYCHLHGPSTAFIPFSAL